MPPIISLPGQQMPVWLKHVLLRGRGATRALAAWTAGPAAVPKVEPQRAGTLPAPAPPLAILAAAVRSPHGASVDELAHAIVANKTSAGLDCELVDDNGFPVMTARCKDASDAMLREEISGWLPNNGMSALHFSEEQWRALTLASAVTSDLVMRATDELVVADGMAPMLQLIPILPADWQPDHCRAVRMWLRHTAAQFGWPFDRIGIAVDAADAEATPSAVFARLAGAAADPAPALTLVVTCVSHIGQQSIDDWAARGTLFTASRPDGVIPGEGAAGLLVANLAQARPIESMAYVLLDRIEETRLEGAAPLGTLVDTVCQHARIGAADIAMVIGDAGQRPQRVLELMGLVSAALPRLDATEDVARIGSVSGGADGSCGAVLFMTGLALARYHTLQREAPTLFVSNEDPHRRCAALVRSALSLPLA